jgi:hypothetical protein
MTLDVWERTKSRTTPAGPTEPSARKVVRPKFFWTVVGGIVVALVVAAVWAAVSNAAYRGVPMDPGNPGGEGAQALARVLDDHGVAVTVTRDQQALLDAAALDTTNGNGTGTTVVVTGTDALSAQNARTMLDRVRGADRLVLVEPSRFLLSALGLAADSAKDLSPADAVTANCTLGGLSPSDTISPGDLTYTAHGPGAVTCFGFGDGFQLVALPAQPGRPEVVVLGDGQILRNSQIGRLDNAGVAVRLLGRGSRLVWYVPSPLDIASTDTTPTSEVPRAVGPLVLLALLALVALMVWRGRRFGPLVNEPLPVVVKAIETTQSRGRLYRKARDTDRAAEVLRARATRRLASYLGLPPGTAPSTVARAAATAAQRDETSTAAILTGPPIRTEAALVTLAHDLTELEKEVRRA